MSRLRRFEVWSGKIIEACRSKGKVDVSEVCEILGEPVHPNLAFQILSWIARLHPRQFYYEGGALSLRGGRR